MKRAITKTLIEWKASPNRKPLIVRGARQVGKTHAIESFGKENFESLLTVNFEEMKEARRAFDGDLTPSLILRDLSSRLNRPITPGKDLLFLDEIQACPNALMSLRFFKEQLPELHVIAAGSLLEFILGEERFSFPVGRVEYCHMRPMSFAEYLAATGETAAINWIREATPDKPIGAATHEKLLRSVKDYCIVGGMPEAVAWFLKTAQYTGIDPIHQHLLNAYENDFGKYPKSSQQKFMKLLFSAAPRLVGEHFKYAKIHAHAQSRDYLESLEVLTQTGILHQVFANTASGLPLASQKQEKKFKLLFLDIGLLPQVIPQILDAEEIISINKGKLAEQFVGQELAAYTKPYQRSTLYYWEREKQGADAEVDYVVEVDSLVIPIEVKAAAKGHLHSLRQFMHEKKAQIGLRISAAPLSWDAPLLSVPFYMIQEIPRLVAHLR